MTLPVEIARLVETFERNRESYAQGRYSETQLRREYIDPFFKALGWDVDNTRGWAEAYKDVIHEDAIRIGATVKAPDYCFRIGGTRKFFVEAKAPTVNLKDAPEPAYQLRRYAYRGAEVSRYSETKPQSFVIYPYVESDKGSPALLNEEDFRRCAPKLYEHLLAHKAKLRHRMDSRRLYADQDWYRHLRPGNFAYIHAEKLIFKGIDKRLSVGLLDKGSVFNGANTPAFIPENLGATSLLYLLGVLNSRLIGFYLVRVCPPKLGGYTRFNATNINATPIRVISFSNKSDRAAHDRMVDLVEQMLSLHRQSANAKTLHEKASLERQVAPTDGQIDALVYELYGLTDAEIKIVEEATRTS